MKALALLLLLPTTALATELDYQLTPRLIAADTYVVQGSTEFFSPQNGGNIANTAFIVTDEGIVVIDTGPSRLYGKQLRAAISQISDKPIVAVFNTHHHPDHALGNQAFSDRPIYALPGTIEGLRTQGNDFSANMYRLAGNWMLNTEVFLPQHSVEAGERRFGTHTLRLLPLHGHTQADLSILDLSTHVLFSGMVFSQRTPATPNSDIHAWLASLAQLQQQPFTQLVPAAGPVGDQQLLEQNADYLRWLDASLQQQAQAGVDMAEALSAPIPQRFDSFSLLRDEYQRSVSYLYPALESAALRSAQP